MFVYEWAKRKPTMLVGYHTTGQFPCTFCGSTIQNMSNSDRPFCEKCRVFFKMDVIGMFPYTYGYKYDPSSNFRSEFSILRRVYGLEVVEYLYPYLKDDVEWKWIKEHVADEADYWRTNYNTPNLDTIKEYLAGRRNKPNVVLSIVKRIPKAKIVTNDLDALLFNKEVK